MSSRLPIWTTPQGERARCEFEKRNGMRCYSLAIYPDGHCWLHTRHLSGSHHERYKADTRQKRKEAWTIHETESTDG